MWYFAWILGVALAATFGVLNAMWIEMHLNDQGETEEDYA